MDPSLPARLGDDMSQEKQGGRWMERRKEVMDGDKRVRSVRTGSGKVEGKHRASVCSVMCVCV